MFIDIITTFRSICTLAFFKCFMSDTGVHTEFRTEHFIWITGVVCSNSVNHGRIKVLCYSKYSSSFFHVVGTEPATSKWFHSETPSDQVPYPLHHVSLPDYLIISTLITQDSTFNDKILQPSYIRKWDIFSDISSII